MADIFSKDKRSRIMSAVKHRGSKIETQAAGTFRKLKIRYRSHPKKLFGNPDFYLPDLNIVVFVDSCFWHGCSRHGSAPKSNGTFWKKKIARNKERDKEVGRTYRKLDRKVVRLWEHDFKTPDVHKKLALLINRSIEK